MSTLSLRIFSNFYQNFIFSSLFLALVLATSCYPTIQGEDILLDPFSERILPQDTLLTFVDSTGGVYNLSLKRKTNYMENVGGGGIVADIDMSYNLHEHWSKIYSGDGLSISYHLTVKLSVEFQDYLTIEVFSEDKDFNLKYEMSRDQGNDDEFWFGAIKKNEVHYNTVSYTDVYKRPFGENSIYLKQDHGLLSFKIRGITYYLLK